MKLTNKRSFWTYDETLEMLNIMMQQESLKAMNGKLFRKDKALRLVQQEMVHRGYTAKDAKQIEYRWKNLKKRYVDIKRDPSLAKGAPFHYYDEIDLMLKSKTVNSSGSGRTYGKQHGTPEENSNERTMGSTCYILPTKSTELNSSKSDGTDQALAEIESNDTILEDSVELSEPPAESPEATQRRSQRSSKGRSRRYNVDMLKPAASSARTTEDDAFRNQKKLVDYQFELYSQAQRESDEIFLQMSRQMLEHCNARFQTFVTEILTESESKTEPQCDKVGKIHHHNMI